VASSRVRGSWMMIWNIVEKDGDGASKCVVSKKRASNLAAAGALLRRGVGIKKKKKKNNAARTACCHRTLALAAPHQRLANIKPLLRAARTAPQA